MIDFTPTLTVAIITYNHKDTVGKTIESVLSQRTDFPVLIEIWDDCSTDGTSEICARYAKDSAGKIVHVLQKKNTFFEPLDKWSFYENYKKIKSKYFYVIEGDDYLTDDTFFSSAVNYLEGHADCGIYAARVRMVDLKKRSAVELPEMPGDEIIVRIEDIGTGRYAFPLIQSRVMRNYHVEFLTGDLPMYLYHLTRGYCKIVNKICAVYNYTGGGIWSELSSDISEKLYQSTFYRMVQYYGFKHENAWFKMLYKKNRRIIRRLSYVVGRRLAWKVWFVFYMVPTFGKASLNKYWNYTSYTRKSRA
ncbi:MAG: glycosyltransferase family 2 protein [Fibrobacter sp.]|nr:glycosyltransferase family 2 protein [Fibrobacter sp.]